MKKKKNNIQSLTFVANLIIALLPPIVITSHVSSGFKTIFNDGACSIIQGSLGTSRIFINECSLPNADLLYLQETDSNSSGYLSKEEVSTEK